MLADRLGTTLQAARDELNAAKKKRYDDKAALKEKLAAELIAIDKRYRKEAKDLRALIRVMDTQADDAPKPKPKTPAK